MAEGVELRPAREADWALVRRWLRQPEVERWLGPATAPETEVIAALTDPAAIARLIIWTGRPVGYAHAIDAAVWGRDLPEGVPAGAWDLDVFIADTAARGRGLGPAVLDELRREVFTTTLATAVCAFAPVENEHAVRAYERAGFQWKHIWRAPSGAPMWLLVSPRPRA
jgi:aminoglycoside 6'-N-acetyltransferase